MAGEPTLTESILEARDAARTWFHTLEPRYLRVLLADYDRRGEELVRLASLLSRSSETVEVSDV